MKTPAEIYETALSPKAIDECSERARSFLSSLKLPKRDIVRFSMTVEEILLKSMEKSEGKTVRFSTGKRFFRPYISLEIEGEANNVFSLKKTNNSLMGDQILKNLGLSPEYTFSGDANNYYFRIKKRTLNPVITLLIALCAALAVGFIGLFIPDTARTGILDGLFKPLHDTFLNILSCIAGPMIFLSVAWGIYGIGDAATLKRIGKKMIVNYAGTVYISVIILFFFSYPFFNLTFTDSSGGISEASSVLSMILGIIPKNIFSPFVEGNTLQIIFLAVVIGIAMLFLGRKTTAVAKAVEQINYIVQFLIEFISKMVPYFIFIVIVQMIWSDTFSVMLKVGKLFAIFISAIIIMSAGIILYTSLKNRTGVANLIKKGLPTLLIALSTASSAAAFGTNMTACRKRYGIDDTISSFGIPLGMVTFKPATAVSYMIMSLFFAQMYSVKISVSWIIVMLFSAGILAIATPPIPGGAMTAYTVLFAQLGIPAEAIAIALACDALFDFIDTGSDQFLLPMVLLNQAERLGMVDRKVLRNKNN